jgi:hypothetical protein
MKGLSHSKCDLCLSVGLTLKVMRSREGVNRCVQCCMKKRKSHPTWLPIWFNDQQKPQYHVPVELSALTEGEKLLIQQISPYIPMQHLQKGAYGSKGHVCSFPQAVNEVCTVLPRLPANVNAISVVKHFKTKDDEPSSMVFRIRKVRVLAALRWLKKYNKVYKDIEIREENLSWMGEKNEMDLDVATRISVDDNVPSAWDDDVNLNGGSDEQNDCERSFGILPSTRHLPGKSSDAVTDGITNALNDIQACPGEQVLMDKHPGRKDRVGAPYVSGNRCEPMSGSTCIEFPYARDEHTDNAETSSKRSPSQGHRIEFPYVSEDPIDEYDESERLFCKAFPWLYPGGVGDINSMHDEAIDLDHWIQHLLRYADGRFARDKMWCFFALNYSQRKSVMKQGGYFVNSFYKDGPSTLDDLQERLRKGETGWVDRITYFGHKVTGSPAYWRYKRQEVYSWINHHIHVGNGVPSLFITLSCAEYHWPDVKRLIEERYVLANLPIPELGTKGSSRHINEFTLVIQEYFQLRVKSWLNTVGKCIFKISHHWLRFEFAPGRGQIHAHMLAIVDNKDILREAYNLRCAGHSQQHANLLSRWVEDTFSMTCGGKSRQKADDESYTAEDHPASQYFHQCDDLARDGDRLLSICQRHKCTSYCLRTRKHM